MCGAGTDFHAFGDGVAVTARAGGMLVFVVDGEAAASPAPGFGRLGLDLWESDSWGLGDEVGGGAAVFAAWGDDAWFFVLCGDGLDAQRG